MDNNKMQIAGQNVAKIFNNIFDWKIIQEGKSTEEVNEYCKQFIKSLNGISGALGYYGFPKEVCISINNEICHGISSKNKILKNGDIISLDIAASFDGYFGDSCVTFFVGDVTQNKQNLVSATYETVWQTISKIKEGVSTQELGLNMETVAKNYGFKTIREFCGHGIGKNMHESPDVPFYLDKTQNYILKEGDFITIEPMLVEGSNKLKILKDNWTAVTVDGKNAAQFEHTVQVLKNGYFVTTYNNFDLKNNKKQTNINL